MVVVKKRQMKQEETVGRSLIIADALQWRGGSTCSQRHGFTKTDDDTAE